MENARLRNWGRRSLLGLLLLLLVQEPSTGKDRAVPDTML